MKTYKAWMNKVVVLVAAVCMMFTLSACSGEGGHHTHTFGKNVTKTVGTSAKCTETTRTCTGCGKKEVVKSTKHKYKVSDPQVVRKNGKATGYQQTYTCKTCKYSYSRLLTASEIKDAGLPSIEELNHKHSWKTKESKATKVDYECYTKKADKTPAKEGYMATYWKITSTCKCGQSKVTYERRDVVDPNYKPVTPTEPTEPQKPTEPKPTDPKPTEPTKPAKCNHSYKQKVVAPTCTKKGYTTYTCSKCGDSYQGDYTNAVGHKFGSWTTTKAATCTANGTKTRTCSNCKQAETETIKATGHSYGSWSTTKNPTCDANGTKTRKCSKCGNAETQTIPATGHNWDEGKMTTKPTNCSDMGVCTYTCLTCGKTKMTQVKGEHSFGSWKYEEYTYKVQHSNGVETVKSHRKVRSCTKCGYVEYGNTPDHHCYKGADTHKVTIVSEPTCSKRGVKRSTCTVCGWSTEFEYGDTGNAHDWKKETKRLTEYTEYTNELDAVISTCKLCGKQTVSYKWGEGSTDYHRYRIPIHINKGTAYGVVADGETDWLSHPTWQTVRRGHVYDSDGYIKQFTVHWYDKSGNRYSQVIHCGKGEMEAWFAEFGMTHENPTKWQLKIQGGFIVPYKVSFS